MSRSQLAFVADIPSGGEPTLSEEDETQATETAPIFRAPSFDQSIYAATARAAGRLNAATTSDVEVSSLLRERQELLDRKFNGTAGRKELNRLEYVRWSLDRIEDARHGHELDRLESAVSAYESFLSDLQKLGQQLDSHRQMKRR